MSEAVAVSRPPTGEAVDAARVHRWLDRHRRIARPDVLYRLYLVALGTVPVTYAAWQGPGDGSAPDVQPLLSGAATWLPVAVALLFVAVARYAAWAGVAIPERGAVAWVLTAPIERSAFLARPLQRAVLTWVGGGALIAHLLSLELVARIEDPPLGLAVAAVGGGAAIGALAVAGCWWVQGAPGSARSLVRASPWAATAVLAAGAAADAAEPARTALLMSGPWGWAVAPVLSAAGGDIRWAGWAVAALAGVATAALVRTWRRVDAVPTSELARRADPVSGVRAATFAGDLRFAAELRRGAYRGLLGPSRRRLPRPRHARAAIPWLGATVLLRSPRWFVSAVIAGVLLPTAARADVVARSPSPALVVALVAVGAVTVVCSQVLDPLRTEESTGFALRHLPWSGATTTFAHLIAPAVAFLVAVAAGAGAALAAGAEVGTVAAAVPGLVLAALVLVPAAAVSVTAPPPEPGALAAGPTLGSGVATRLVGLPLGAVVVALFTAGGVLALAEGADHVRVLASSLPPAGLACGGFLFGLRRRVTRRDR